MKHLLARLSRISFLLLLAGCAAEPARTDGAFTKVKECEVLQQKISAEGPADQPDSIAKRAGAAFINAKGLSATDKVKLTKIYRETYFQAEAIKSEIGKSKSLLFKLVSTKSYDSSEVDALKTIIVNLDQKRLIIMFKALADVQEVVGYGNGKEQFYEHFYKYEYPLADQKR